MRKIFLGSLFLLSAAYGVSEPIIKIPRQVYVLNHQIKPLVLKYYIDPVCGHIVNVDVVPDNFKAGFDLHYHYQTSTLSGAPDRVTTPDFYPNYIVLAKNSCGESGKGYFRIIVTAPLTPEKIGDREEKAGDAFYLDAKDYFMTPNEESGDVQFDTEPKVMDEDGRAILVSTLGLFFNMQTGVLSGSLLKNPGKYRIVFSAHNNIKSDKPVKNAFWLNVMG